ncbi:MAG: discoidin domain-containing protein, partial [Bryobacteraceae bacterium]|nr:discoidin domain-containing protein [Bryobacteraceae bacterium]
MRPILLSLLMIAAMGADSKQLNLPPGQYPGKPAENFAPAVKASSAGRRNLALRRAAYQSSSYDYNLTAQLVTDGIRDTAMPRWIVTSSSAQGVLPRNQREWPLDDNWVTTVDVKGRTAWVQVEFDGAPPPVVDRISLTGSLTIQGRDNNDWAVTVLGSDDGKIWAKLGRASGMAKPSGEMNAKVDFARSKRRAYRLQFDSGRPTSWQLGEVRFFNSGARVRAGGPYLFTSAWMPASAGEEWVYVDLGAVSAVDQVNLNWIRQPESAALEVSDDAKSWRQVQSAASGENRFAAAVQTRYVRVKVKGSVAAGPAVLSEMEVFGTGGVDVVAAAAPSFMGGKLHLAGGAWRLERAPQVTAGPVEISTAGFQDSSWLVATVPATTLVSYVNAGALPDPNFGNNQLAISDAFFQSEFWYRTEFETPPSAAGRQLLLDFDGINWKASVYLNGTQVGRVEGGFMRARFNVGKLLKASGRNALAVLVDPTATPGSTKEKTFENPDKNGGALGADNPTYHASIGWDWIPTIRGRNTGIWNDVWLTRTGPVTIENPHVTTDLPLPDTSRADVSIEVTLVNHTNSPMESTVFVGFGQLSFMKRVKVEAGAKAVQKYDPTNTPELRIQNPKLWWPAGYGEPNLYDVRLSVQAGGFISDSKAFKAGIRQFAYSDEGGALRMWINGRRLVPKGGNWGFPESMLKYRGREYDAAVRYHREMNFNMIRNWVGQTGDDEFYEACDRHGIVVWQDFWLANPWDGPEPDDNRMFMANAEDMILRIRNHASVGLYCGRNEGYPLKTLDDDIRASLKKLHPGIHYISSSADDTVSGHGPYRALDVKSYFEQRATPKFHSEMGMPNIVTMDSLREFMDEKDRWPQGAVWGLHDFCLTGAQGGESFRSRIDKSYGGAKSVDEWISLAQFVNYEGYRAMYEAQSKNRMGLLIWMSHPAWPSFVWQTYDYYLEPTASYFASKKAAEPLHIQWNPLSDAVEVVNYSGGNAT